MVHERATAGAVAKRFVGSDTKKDRVPCLASGQNTSMLTLVAESLNTDSVMELHA